jgi:tetratricopeptide (TPR) repeat protein
VSGYDHLNRAIELMQAVRLDDPEMLTQADLAIASGDLDSDRAALAAAYAIRGHHFHDVSDRVAARRAFRQAVATDPQMPQRAVVLHELGESLFQDHHCGEAAESFAAALEADPHHPFAPDTHALLATCLYVELEGTASEDTLLQAAEHFATASEMLTGSDIDRYVVQFDVRKANYQAVAGRAMCLMLVPRLTEQWAAIRLFESAAQIAERDIEVIGRRTVAPLWGEWARAYTLMGLPGEAERIKDNERRFWRRLGFVPAGEADGDMITIMSGVHIENLNVGRDLINVAGSYYRVESDPKLAELAERAIELLGSAADDPAIAAEARRIDRSGAPVSDVASVDALATVIAARVREGTEGQRSRLRGVAEELATESAGGALSQALVAAAKALFGIAT